MSKITTKHQNRTTIAPRNFLPGDFAVQLNLATVSYAPFRGVPVGEAAYMDTQRVGQQGFSGFLRNFRSAPDVPSYRPIPVSCVLGPRQSSPGQSPLDSRSPTPQMLRAA